MTIFQKIEKFVKDVFKTTLEVFLDALKMSPNAQGYVSGSITELLLKQHMESNGYEIKRIREKWEGKKHLNHHGDFYFRKKGQDKWFVLESKGVKSNSEKWHKLYNYNNLAKFLFDHSNKINWIDSKNDVETQIEAWIQDNLPKFMTEYSDVLYDYEEVQKYLSNVPKKETSKLIAINKLKDFSRDEINEKINERLEYINSRIRVLETHFVSGTSGSSERTQATPRKDEFNLISIDVFLKYEEHKFLFANPNHLDSSGTDANHLQQNYIMGFVFINKNGELNLKIADEWYENANDAFDTIDESSCVNEEDMQIDLRNFLSNEK